MMTNFSEASFNFPLSVKQSLSDMSTQQNQRKEDHMACKNILERSRAKSNKTWKHNLPTIRILQPLERVAECPNAEECWYPCKDATDPTMNDISFKQILMLEGG